MEWRKSSFCSTDHVTEQCIEISTFDRGGEPLLMLKDEHFTSAAMVTSKAAFRSFLAGAKAGEFDDLA